jgi:hypothetical protein
VGHPSPGQGEDKALFNQSAPFQGLSVGDKLFKMWDPAWALVDRATMESTKGKRQLRTNSLGRTRLGARRKKMSKAASVWVVIIVLMVTQSKAGDLHGAGMPESVSVCELATDPSKYDGKMVVVVKGWIVRNKTKLLLDTYLGNCIANIDLVLPETVRPNPDFAVQRDENFEAFETAIRQRTHIEGTFEGGFDCLSKCKAGKSKGHRSRLVLRRVVELDISPTRGVDR